MKKYLFFMLMLALTLVVFTACSGDDDDVDIPVNSNVYANGNGPANEPTVEMPHNGADEPHDEPNDSDTQNNLDVQDDSNMQNDLDDYTEPQIDEYINIPQEEPPVAAQAFTTTPSIVSTSTRTIALRYDGTVWTWGDTSFVDVRTEFFYTPVQIPNLANVSAVDAGGSFLIALKYDGTVWAMGGNRFGYLGDGTTTNSWTTPVQVHNLTNVTAIAAGGVHSVALKYDGTVWAWGNSLLGDGTREGSTTPVQVQNLTNIIAIAASNGLQHGDHTLALRDDGTVWAWGNNRVGQLGNGTQTTPLYPVQVQSLTNITAIVAGQGRSFALRDDGTIWAWGLNNMGQLGDGTTTTQNSPVQVPDLTGVTALSSGEEHTVVLLDDGTVWAWGNDNSGRLGDGADVVGVTRIARTPVQAQNLTNITYVTACVRQTFALRDDGTVWAWGANGRAFGLLGVDLNVASNTPSQVLGEDGIGFLYLGTHQANNGGNSNVQTPSIDSDNGNDLDFEPPNIDDNNADIQETTPPTQDDSENNATDSTAQAASFEGVWRHVSTISAAGMTTRTTTTMTLLNGQAVQRITATASGHGTSFTTPPTEIVLGNFEIRNDRLFIHGGEVGHFEDGRLIFGTMTFTR